MRLKKALSVISRFREEFSFVRGNYLLLLITWMILGLVGEIPNTYYGLYVIELGGSAFIIGMIDAVFQFSRAAVTFPGGYLADKYGRRKLIFTMTFLVGLAQLFYALAPNWNFILIGTLIAGLSRIYLPAMMAISADSIPQEHRGIAYSLHSLVTGIASMPGPLIAGLFLVEFGLVPGMRLAYLLASSSFVVATFLRFRLKETVVTHDRVDLGEILRSYPKAVKECFDVWRHLPRSMLYVLISNNTAGFCLSMLWSYRVLYAVEELGISELRWSIILTIFTASLMVFALPAGKVVDKFNRKGPMILANALLALSSALLLFGDFARLITMSLVMGLSMSLFQTAYPSLTMDLTPKELRGRVLGSTQFIGAIIWAVGGFLGGFVYQNIDPRLVFVPPILFIVPQILIILFLIKEPERREP